MTAPELIALAFALLCGLTICGLAGSVLELAWGARLTFADPFVSPRHLLRSVAVTMLAGPFMLANDALTARREHRISQLALLSCACSACVWAFAAGIVVLDLASRAAGLLG